MNNFAPPLASAHDLGLPSFVGAALAAGSGAADIADVRAWLDDYGTRSQMRVERIPLDAMEGWYRAPDGGDIRHRSGRFFSVEGLEVLRPDGPVPHWNQPIINQPEVGILGVLMRRFDGVPRFLLQAKAEPGNAGGLQLSPTVQATRSNYTRVHQGRPVPYLGYFQDTSPHRVISDIRQSEQGSWFLCKRNRNMVVEVTEDVPVADGFRWFSLPQIHRLLAVDDLVNMDARTVLSCLPFAGGVPCGAIDGDGLHAALLRSCRPDAALHSNGEILSWITSARSMSTLRARSRPLDSLPDWRFADGRITHERGAFFDIIGVGVEAEGREVAHWSQPMLEPRAEGVIAFVVRRVAGVLHALVRIHHEPGYVDEAELAPTVQTTPANLEHLPPSAHPDLLDQVLDAAPSRILFDTVLSEEGGRFHHARNRYLVVEAEADDDPLEAVRDPGQFRWMTLYQLSELLRHSHYLNVQARTLVACTRSLLTRP
ncbi:NDP-hexose 2,3-dehydratase family protein [Spirillospora sp. NPDC052269]